VARAGGGAGGARARTVTGRTARGRAAGSATSTTTVASRPVGRRRGTGRRRWGAHAGGVGPATKRTAWVWAKAVAVRRAAVTFRNFCEVSDAMGMWGKNQAAVRNNTFTD
jgi:hypothetical protein